MASEEAREKQRIRQRRYYERNREKELARQKKYRQSKPEPDKPIPVPTKGWGSIA